MDLVLFTCWVNKNMQSLCFYAVGELQLVTYERGRFFRHPVEICRVKIATLLLSCNSYCTITDSTKLNKQAFVQLWQLLQKQ